MEAPPVWVGLHFLGEEEVKKAFWCVFILIAIFALAGCGKKKTTSSRQFVKSEVCRDCHEDFFSQWSTTMHSYSQADPLYQKLYLQADKDTKGKAEEYCAAARCHTPIGNLAGEIPPISGSKLSKVAQEGVNCDFCHTVSEVKKVGQGGYISSPGPTKRGPFSDSNSTFHTAKYVEFQRKSEFCGMCHNVNHPKNNLSLQATYTEWKNSPYADQGTQCQDCHMAPSAGVAALDGLRRQHINAHSFVGGNTLLPAFFGQNDTQGLVEERLKSAAEVSITSTSSFAPGALGSFTINVTNKGAGHYLPTGVTELREMWLDVKVTDATGKVIYHSGEIRGGDLAKGSVVYKTVVVDENGEETKKVWLADKILSDKRIPPKETVQERYSFRLPAGSRGPFSIEATLRYRSANQNLVYDLLGGGATVSVVDMAYARAQIP